MVKKKTKTVLLCTCELKGCGKSWESQSEYIPERCRWCGRYTWNGADKRGTRTITALGKTQLVSAWAKDTGIDKSTIRMRLRLGWTDEDAVTAPVGTLRKLRGKKA